MAQYMLWNASKSHKSREKTKSDMWWM